MAHVAATVSAIVAGAILFSPISASAERLVAQLDWSAPSACVERAELATAVAATLGDLELRDGAVGGPVDARVRAAIVPVEGGFEAHIAVHSEAPTRQRKLAIEGACARLTDAIVVVIALMLDEVRRARPRTLVVQPPRNEPSGRPIDVAVRSCSGARAMR